MSTPLLSTKSAALAIERVKYSHDAMIDLLIAQPGISQNELAKAFGYTAPWISRVVNSDAFQARLAERKNDLVDPTILEGLDERLNSAAKRSLEIVMERLEVTKDTNQALKALEISTKALGYGARAQNLNVQQNFVVALPGKVADAAAWAQRGRDAGAEAGSGVQQVAAELVERVGE